MADITNCIPAGCSEEKGHVFVWISWESYKPNTNSLPDPEMRCECGKMKYGHDNPMVDKKGAHR